MCCFGVRVFALIFMTVFSFALHKFYPALPVVCYYLLMANLLAFAIFCLFFKGALPAFVKQGAVHYFSFIGGVAGAFLAMGVFRKFARDAFSFIEILALIFWVVLCGVLALNFTSISSFFQGFLA